MPKKKKKHGEHYRLSKPADDTSRAYDSEYEDKDGERYRYDSDLGVGRYAEARLFKSIKSGKTKVVLSPVLDDGHPEEPGGLSFTPETEASFSSLKESISKYAFFKALYPKEPPFLVCKQGTYRIVLPKVAGIPYKQTPCVSAFDAQIKEALGLIDALSHAQDNEIVIFDLKEDNILFDASTGKFSLIDGGLHKLVGDRLSNAFICETDAMIAKYKVKCPQIAPECWALKDKPCVKADFKMDIFSLGYIWRKKFIDPIPLISHIIDSCLLEDPNQRPTLPLLKEAFRRLLPIYEVSDEESSSETGSVVENYELHRSDWDAYVKRSVSNWLYGCDSP